MRESYYSWNEYSFHFKLKAQEFNLSKDTILGLLSYAERLSKNNVPIIYDVKHLSYLTGYRDSYINRAINKPANFYRTFKIPKKNGSHREITEPLPGLKALQYWILNNIIKVAPVNPFNNAYTTNKSILTNSKYHIKQPMVLNLDIEKYFDNITYERVYNFFLTFGYTTMVSACLAKLCTLNNGIPQGSPSSPYLSSILTKKIDEQLFEYCRSWGLRYSRYADDITVSGKFHSGTIIFGVKRIILENGFSVNDLKTKVKKQHQRQMVTGIVVNNKMSINNKDLKKLRQEMFYINKFGLESHAQKIQLDKRHYVQHLLGKVNFYLFVKKNNPELIIYKGQLIQMLAQESLPF